MSEHIKDTEETLIDEVCIRGCLYDKADPNYKNSKMREKSWRDIGVILGKSGKIIIFYLIYHNQLS